MYVQVRPLLSKRLSLPIIAVVFGLVIFSGSLLFLLAVHGQMFPGQRVHLMRHRKPLERFITDAGQPPMKALFLPL